jgi:hypothetical protein
MDVVTASACFALSRNLTWTNAARKLIGGKRLESRNF